MHTDITHTHSFTHSQDEPYTISRTHRDADYNHDVGREADCPIQQRLKPGSIGVHGLVSVLVVHANAEGNLSHNHRRGKRRAEAHRMSTTSLTLNQPLPGIAQAEAQFVELQEAGGQASGLGCAPSHTGVTALPHPWQQTTPGTSIPCEQSRGAAPSATGGAWPAGVERRMQLGRPHQLCTGQQVFGTDKSRREMTAHYRIDRHGAKESPEKVHRVDPSLARTESPIAR